MDDDYIKWIESEEEKDRLIAQIPSLLARIETLEERLRNERGD